MFTFVGMNWHFVSILIDAFSEDAELKLLTLGGYHLDPIQSNQFESEPLLYIPPPTSTNEKKYSKNMKIERERARGNSPILAAGDGVTVSNCSTSQLLLIIPDPPDNIRGGQLYCGAGLGWRGRQVSTSAGRTKMGNWWKDRQHEQSWQWDQFPIKVWEKQWVSGINSRVKKIQ